MGTEEEASVYAAVGGEPALRRLAAAWHERCLADPLASHPFSHGVHPQHTDRLAAYWVESLGGPPAYTSRLGDHSGVLRLHAGNGDHAELDDKAVELFDRALEDTGLASDPRLRRTLHDWFRWATDDLSGHPRSPDDVPADVSMPHWSWDGPVR